ncbi:hypothetical protein MY4824_009410 [Beauveria thailandica]
MESVVEGNARRQSENDRLDAQHEIVKSFMGGKLLRVPVDLADRNLRILDSGTAQANWLLDMARLVDSAAQLIGTDIAPDQFPAVDQRPPNMKLQKQSIFEAWPEDMQDNFDIVHQRFVLAACKSDEQGHKAVSSLFNLTKPGGWIELHEGNMLKVQEGPNHVAMMRFRDIAVDAWRKLGLLPDPGPRLGQWLRDTNALDVYEEVQTIRIGAAAETEEDGERGITLCMTMFGAIRRITAGQPGSPSQEEFHELEMQLKKELREVGNEWNYHLVYDGHNDWMHMIRAYYDFQVDERFEPHRDLGGHVDLKRLVQGKAGGVFWSVYVECPKEEDDFSDAAHYESMRDTFQQIDLLYRIVDLYSDSLEIAHSADDILRIFRKGKCASLMGAEGLHQIGNSSSVLRIFHRLGVRYITLTHGKNNLFADSATSKAPAHNGLSPQGRDIVREMNRIGMMVDLSHVSEAVMLDALKVSTAPVIFSHSSTYALVPNTRNVPDNVLDILKSNGGIIMISFIPWLTNKDADKSTVADVVDHILHVAGRIGFDHIGLGSDFDGMPSHVNGLEDVASYPNVVAAMLEREIEVSDIEKVMGLNLIRVFKQVEEVAAASDKLPVLEDGVKRLWNNDIRAFVRKLYPNAEHDRLRE